MNCYRLTELVFNIEQLQDDYHKLITKVPFGHKRHLHLTHRKGNIDKYFGDDESYIEFIDGKAVNDNHYTIMNDLVEGTYLGDTINKVKEFFPITKCALVRIPPNFMYRIHEDPYDHIHIPITGNDCGCMFNCDNETGTEVHWFKVDGSTYYCRTKHNLHTFFNCPQDGLQERVTLMMSLYRDMELFPDDSMI